MEEKQDALYRCQICNRMIHKDHALEHIKAEEYLLRLLKKDHPEWEATTPLAPKCIQYYRTLVTLTEI